jgi:hypothetical protein
MAGFLFKLETPEGLPADPPTLSAAVPNWSAGDTIALSAGRMLRVVGVRDEDADSPPVLVVEKPQGTFACYLAPFCSGVVIRLHSVFLESMRQA